jgi:hypothetical protein
VTKQQKACTMSSGGSSNIIPPPQVQQHQNPQVPTHPNPQNIPAPSLTWNNTAAPAVNSNTSIPTSGAPAVPSISSSGPLAQPASTLVPQTYSIGSTDAK